MMFNSSLDTLNEKVAKSEMGKGKYDAIRKEIV